MSLTPHRLQVRVPLAESITDLDPAIQVFHRFIQRGLVEGLLLDIADYRHVPQGPGVMLVGHDIDYALETDAFVATRKRHRDDVAAVQLRDALRMALGALGAIAEDGALKVVADVTRIQVTAHDRLIGDADLIAAHLAEAITPSVKDLFGDEATVEAAAHPHGTVTIDADGADAGALLQSLGGAQPTGQSPWDISPEDLAALRDAGQPHVLVDVREASEREIATLDGTHIPLVELSDRLDELDREAKVVVHCRSGLRGATAVDELRSAGFTDAWNLNGGLMAWADRIDPSIPRY